MANVFYNRIIRKLVVGFGNLFDNITLVRYNPDESEAERFIVPIAYATKEDYVKRLEDDYNLNKKIQTTLPRMSYDMNGFSYDATRKQNTNIRNFVATGGAATSQYNPVPYNFDFNLYLYVRNIEDASQILEHILSYFTPDYTIKLNLIPEMGIVKEIPVVLNSTVQDIDYEGNKDRDTRIIIWTLNFTIKGYIFGPTSQVGLIKNSITNVYNEITTDQQIQFTMSNTGIGVYQTGEFVYQGYSLNTATATAKVVEFNNNKLTLTNINGNFVSSMPVVGARTNSNYSFISYNIGPQKLVVIDNTPVPANTVPGGAYTYLTTITETANTGS
jgi:hypothetical protein